MSSSPYGPLFDGEMNPLYTSASQLQTADHAEQGCLRKWHFEKVAGKKAPQTKSQARGTDTHSEIQRYIETGELTLGPLALTARRLIPAPVLDARFGPWLHVEQEIGDTARVAADGVRVVGKIDLVNASGFYLTGDGEIVDDWKSCVEVNDWKTTSSVDWIKTPGEVARTLQMTAYGVYALRTFDVERVRLSHVYMITKGAAQPAVKRTSVVEAEDILARWEYARGLQRSIRHAAKIPADRSDLVDGNADACGAYRGCPHRSYCNPPARQDSLSALFGAYMTPQEQPPMSLLATLGMAPVAPAADPVAAQLAQLKAAEAAPPPRAKSAFELACDRFTAAGWGFPPLAADCAAAKSALSGTPIAPGAALAGSGRLAGIQAVSDPAIFIQLSLEVEKTAAAEVAAKPASPPPVASVVAPAVPALLPPDAPASNPLLAADPLPGFMGTPEAAPKPEKKKPGRPKKSDVAPVPTTDAALDGPAAPAARPETILKHFTYAHLPERLQAVSAPICDLATDLVAQLPQCAERTAGLRKLLEAKDCFVRAALEASS